MAVHLTRLEKRGIYTTIDIDPSHSAQFRAIYHRLEYDDPMYAEQMMESIIKQTQTNYVSI